MEDKNNFLIEMFDQHMKLFVESGIAERIVKNFTTLNYLPADFENKPLSMSQLNVWFVFWLCGLLIAFVEFLGEKLLNLRCKKK